MNVQPLDEQSQSAGLSSFVLMSHDREEASLRLSATKANECFGLFSIIIDAQTGDALVEKHASAPINAKGSDGHIGLLLNGQELLDVTHIRPGAKFVINNERFSYLKPLDVMIDAEKPGRRERLLQLASREPWSLSLIGAWNASLIEAKSAAMGKVSPAAGGQPAQKKPSGLRILSNRSVRIVAVAIFALAGVGLGVRRHYQDRSKSAHAPTDRLSMRKPSGETPVRALPTALPEVQTSVKSATPVLTHQPVATQPQTKTLPPTATQPVKTARKSVVGPLPEKVTPELRNKIAEYALEARFDPDGAMRKLEELKNKLPAGSAGRQEVQKKLDTLR